MRTSNLRNAGAAGLLFLACALGTTSASAAPLAFDGTDIGTDDCSATAVPDGNRFEFDRLAQGEIVYRWDGFKWTAVNTKAFLSDDVTIGDSDDPTASPRTLGQRTTVGRIIAGPTFVAADGSKIVGSVVGECRPDPGAAPNQLIDVVGHAGRGLFSHMTYVVRRHVFGGLAPDDPGTTVGQKTKVVFTALYDFYSAAN